MDQGDIKARDAVSVARDVRYLPLPNTVEVVITDTAPDPSLTRTAFALALMPDGSLLMANNRRRGMEIPGGHIDPGEDAMTAATREVMEETGAVLSPLVPLGVLRMKSSGTVPDGWRYPHPLGFQQFLMGMVQHLHDYIENDECLAPVILTPGTAMSPDGPLSHGQRAFYLAAHRALLGCEPGHDIPGPSR